MNPTLQTIVQNIQLMVCYQDQHQGTVLLSNDPNLAVFRRCRLATAATVNHLLALSRLLRCHSKHNQIVKDQRRPENISFSASSVK